MSPCGHWPALDFCRGAEVFKVVLRITRPVVNFDIRWHSCPLWEFKTSDSMCERIRVLYVVWTVEVIFFFHIFTGFRFPVAACTILTFLWGPFLSPSGVGIRVPVPGSFFSKAGGGALGWAWRPFFSFLWSACHVTPAVSGSSPPLSSGAAFGFEPSKHICFFLSQT